MLKKEVAVLSSQGSAIYFAMYDEAGKLSKEAKEQIESKGIKLPSVKNAYEPWYSESLRLIAQIIPDRKDDFVKLYKNEKRKDIDFLSYTISDSLLGLETKRYGEIIADKSAAIPKMKVQLSILEAAEKRFESSLFDLQEVLQADLFDDELAAAGALNKNGFFRAAGAVAGVVLEKHLAHVCKKHSLKSSKRHPTLSDFYQLLKENEVIDTPKWRFIQHLSDLRNLCDHDKGREPTKADIGELIEGVDKVIKTVF